MFADTPSLSAKRACTRGLGVAARRLAHLAQSTAKFRTLAHSSSDEWHSVRHRSKCQSQVVVSPFGMVQVDCAPPSSFFDSARVPPTSGQAAPKVAAVRPMRFAEECEE